jgi:hypothetical protein
MAMPAVDYISVDPAYREVLHAAGLTSVDSILSRLDGDVAAWSRSTDTLHVPGPAGGPGFYLKRYYYATWRKRFRTMLRGTFFGVHRGEAEYAALQAMRNLGINAARPVAYGARRLAHFVTACFLITEEVPGSTNLTTFASDVAAGRRALTRAERLAMIARLARQVTEMHAAGFCHGQMFWRNILVRRGLDGQPEFFFLDAQPPPSWRRVSPTAAWWHRELANLLISALPFTTRTDRLRFLRHYLGGRLKPEIKAHVHAIEACSRQWHRHELQRIKMNDLFERWRRQLDLEHTPAAQTEVNAARDGASP